MGLQAIQSSTALLDQQEGDACFLCWPGSHKLHPELIRGTWRARSPWVPLTDAELAAVLDWMIQRFGPAPDARRAARYTAAEVARHRRTPLSEVEGTRRRLLAGMVQTPSERP